jgi:cbb3-type cytochrome c oxidase subunit III
MRNLSRIIVSTALTAGIALMLLASPKTAQPQATAAAPKPVSANFVRGQQIFLEYCAMCHGDAGNGDGDFGEGLKQKAGVSPANLTDRVIQDRLGHAGVRRVIEKGGGHTGKSNLMPAWGESLTPRQIDDVANYVMHLPDLPAGVSSSTQRAYANSPPGVPAEGLRLFVHHCAACHGMQGKGDGALAASLKAKHNIQPRNLTDSKYLSTKTDKELFMTVTLGGGHMGKSPYMPVWAGYLTPEQIKNLVSYIRVLSHTTPQP